MLRTDVRGYSMTDVGMGAGSCRRASSTRRFILCLVTERRATFLDTTTACPVVFPERIALKFAEDTL